MESVPVQKGGIEMNKGFPGLVVPRTTKSVQQADRSAIHGLCPSGALLGAFPFASLNGWLRNLTPATTLRTLFRELRASPYHYCTAL
jgi:hypothetical protein